MWESLLWGRLVGWIKAMIVQWPTGQCTLPQAHSYLHSFWKSAGKQPELARLLPLPSQLHGKLPQLPVTARGTAVPAQGVVSISHPPKVAHILLFYYSVTWAQALRTCGMVPIKEPLEALSPKESLFASPLGIPRGTEGPGAS